MSIPLDLSWRRFRIHLAQTSEEIQEAKALRWSVFRHEWEGQAASEGVDEDPFDARADHLLLRDAASGLLVGTYRFVRGTQPSDFYAHTEFHLDPLFTRQGTMVELGRACLRREWRNNLGVIALFQGILAYARAVDASYLFGCSSVLCGDVQHVARVCRLFQEDQCWLPDADVLPLPQLQDPQLAAALMVQGPLRDAERKQAQDSLPPLLRTYVRAGALVSRLPIFDPQFRCWDWLTVLDLDAANLPFIERGAVSAVQRP